jgi:DNA ligase (NAD+)
MYDLSIYPQSENYYDPDDKTIELLAFIGKTFVITGTLSQPRPEFQKIIEANGGKVSGSISKNTNYLLCGENAGSKRDKAESLGVKILSEEELQNMI